MFKLFVFERRWTEYVLVIILEFLFVLHLQIRGSRSKLLQDKVLVNCQYSMATFSTSERKRRPRGDRKSQEMTMHLQQTFNAAILTSLHPRSQIDIFVEVKLMTIRKKKDTHVSIMHLFGCTHVRIFFFNCFF